MALSPRIVIVCMLVFSTGDVLISTAALADKHALLIGIGSYPEPILELEGPPHDVDALRSRLVGNWSFDAAKITTLVDTEATKGAILGQLDRLAATTRPGDYVLVYYSGHGTSAFDDDLRFEGTDLGKWTGALIPYDYRVDDSPGLDRVARTDQLIIGRRDLRPRLAKLDVDRNVFVVFDTCFSGNSVRSISRRKVRWVSPELVLRSQRGIAPEARRSGVAPEARKRGIGRQEDPFDHDAIFGAATAPDKDYPYRRLIYLSAARKYERAEDIPPWESIDNRPHGALTNALLQGLDGSADINGDDRLTYEELYEFVQDEVSEKNQHMPQLLFPKTRPELVHGPIFEHGRRTFATAQVPSHDGLRVKISHDLRHLRQRIAQLPRVSVTDSVEYVADYDISIERQGDGLVAFYHSSGDLVDAGFDDLSPQDLLGRLGRLAQAQALIDLTYPRQHFELSLELSEGRGFLTADQRFDITARSDRPAALLLLNIDKTGTVSVLYPIHAAELRLISGLQETFEVIPPYGTEYLKLFAFRQPPKGLNRWLHRQVDALDPDFDRLLQLLREPGVASAQARLKVATVGELVRED